MVKIAAVCEAMTGKFVTLRHILYTPIADDCQHTFGFNYNPGL